MKILLSSLVIKINILNKELYLVVSDIIINTSVRWWRNSINNNLIIDFKDFIGIVF